MKKLLESWVFSIILLTSVMTVGAREVDYGLKFRSHETIQDERTGLNLLLSRQAFQLYNHENFLSLTKMSKICSIQKYI